MYVQKIRLGTLNDVFECNALLTGFTTINLCGGEKQAAYFLCPFYVV